MTPEAREKARARSRAWKAANPDKVSAARKRWLERHPERAKEAQARMNAKRVGRVRDPVKAKAAWRRWYYKHRAVSVPTTQPRGQLFHNPIYAAANAAIPRGLPLDVRDDVVSMVCLAVLEGEISLREVPNMANQFINRHYRQFSKFGTASLDAPLYDDSRKTLLDTLAAPEPYDEYEE